MTGSQHVSPGDIQFHLVYDRDQYAESSYVINNFFQVMIMVTHLISRQGKHLIKYVQKLNLVSKQKTSVTLRRSKVDFSLILLIFSFQL